jgi:hypothetical protein
MYDLNPYTLPRELMTNIRCELYDQLPNTLINGAKSIVSVWSTPDREPLADFLGPTLGTQTHLIIQGVFE